MYVFFFLFKPLVLFKSKTLFWLSTRYNVRAFRPSYTNKSRCEYNEFTTQTDGKFVNENVCDNSTVFTVI